MTGSGSSKLRIVDYDAIGFDLDHTLAKYSIPNLFDMVHNGLGGFLVDQKGANNILLSPFDQDFCTRGLVLDITKGNFLKLSEDGTILRASHGTKFMSDEEILKEYEGSRHWPYFEELIDTVDNIGDDHFRIFENFFDMPGMVACARMIDLYDQQAGGREQDYKQVWPLVREAYNFTYNPQGFALNSGGFFPEWKRNTSTYTHPCNLQVKAWLSRLKQTGKKIFVITSSYADYARASLEHVLGPDWETYFDICICFAKKPGFFRGNCPFLRIGGDRECEPVSELISGNMYSQGNAADFMKYLRRVTQKGDPKVLYFGDSLRSDIFPAKQAGWDTALVLEEMESELPPGVSLMTEDPRDLEGAPHNKRPRILGPSDLEKKFLTSGQWGSFFTDTHTGNADQDSSQPGMNTLWGYIVRKYADIAIPQLEYITHLPHAHEFERFDHEESRQWGFYPRVPQALDPHCLDRHTPEKVYFTIFH